MRGSEKIFISRTSEYIYTNAAVPNSKHIYYEQRWPVLKNKTGLKGDVSDCMESGHIQCALYIKRRILNIFEFNVFSCNFTLFSGTKLFSYLIFVTQKEI